MAPKKRAVKKGKNVLTRGRTAKQQKQEEEIATTTASETDDNGSEQMSPVKSETAGSVTSANDHEGSDSTEEEVVQSKEKSKESWEDLPSLVNEFRIGDGSITYITTAREHREFELEARRNLLQEHIELENLKSSMEYSLKVMRSMCPEVKMGKVSHAIGKLGCPSTVKDLILKLATSPAAQQPEINVEEPFFEESETEAEDVVGVPYTGSSLHSKKFPSPAKMAKYQYYTPQGSNTNRVFQFGTGKGLSTNKAARLPKPGEVVYSEGGSPILQRKVPDNQTLERVEVIQPDGSKIEVEIVYRGGKDVEKIRGFKEFARDVRGIAASRATSVRQNRIQPPKIVKSGAQSATKSKNKPEWR